MSQKYTSTKSIWAVEVESSRRPGGTFSPTQYSTLNEYFGIETATTLPTGVAPEAQYIVIGRGGHRNVVGGTSDSLVDVLQHRITNARLFTHLPFVLREVGNDLSAAERAKYRMRKLETFNGKQYIAYYMMKITLPTVTPVIEKLTVTNGTVAREAYVPTAQQLVPKPVSMTNGKVNMSTGVHLSVTTPFTIKLTKADITNIMNAVDIIYGDARYAVISEMAICSGIDQNVNSTIGGTSVNYTEVLAGQIYNWIAANINLQYQSEELEYALRVGDTLPYLT